MRIEYKLTDNSLVNAEDVLWKVMKRYIFSEPEEGDELDPDIQLAILAARSLVESEELPKLTAMYIIDSDFATTIASLIYLGLKHKTTEINNNLQILVTKNEDTEETVESDTVK